MNRVVARTCLALGSILGLPACVRSLEASVLPGVDLGVGRSFHVARHERDSRDVASVIRGELQGLGRRAESGPLASMPAGTDLLVAYEDRWQWDITMYLLSLRIEFRDPKTSATLASGTSTRTSLARKSPPTMAKEVLLAVFGKAAPVPPGGKGPPSE